MNTLEAVYSQDTAVIPDVSERTKCVLGAFNAGEGRVAGAQHLAEQAGKNPQRWADVQAFLELAGADQSEANQARQYVEQAPLLEAEFAQKSSADKSVRDENPRTGRYDCTEGHFVYGDFNRDGLKDAAVVISEGEGGTGHFRALAFLITDGRQLVHRASYGLGDRARINSLTVRDHRVIVDAYVHGPHDCMAWPTKRIRSVYDYLQPDRAPLGQTILSPGRDRAP